MSKKITKKLFDLYFWRKEFGKETKEKTERDFENVIKKVPADNKKVPSWDKMPS